MTKYIGLLRDRFNNYDYPVFTLTDVRVLLGRMRISPEYLKIMINHLIKTGEIRRIAKGVYTFHDDIAVVGFAFRPFYYGLEDALTYRNFWTQATNPVILTENPVREGLRKFDSANYVVKRIKPRFFFGFDFIKYYDMWLPVSDAEKTLIDLIYFKHGIIEDALGPLLKSLNKEKLDNYLKHYSAGFRKRLYSYVGANRLAESAKEMKAVL